MQPGEFLIVGVILLTLAVGGFTFANQLAHAEQNKIDRCEALGGKSERQMFETTCAKDGALISINP